MPSFYHLCDNVNLTFKSSLRRYSVKKVVLKNFANFAKKARLLEPLFNKVAGLKACNFIKKRFQHMCLPVKFSKFLRTPILKNICEPLIHAMTLFIYGLSLSFKMLF